MTTPPETLATSAQLYNLKHSLKLHTSLKPVRTRTEYDSLYPTGHRLLEAFDDGVTEGKAALANRLLNVLFENDDGELRNLIQDAATHPSRLSYEGYNNETFIDLADAWADAKIEGARELANKILEILDETRNVRD